MGSKTNTNLSLSLEELIKNAPKKFNQKKKKNEQELNVPNKMQTGKKVDNTIAGKGNNTVKKTIDKSLASKNSVSYSTSDKYYTVKVKGFSKDITDVLIKCRFGVAGKVLNVNMLPNNNAFVAYGSQQCCVDAIKVLNGSKIKGEVITVEQGKTIANPNIKVNNTPTMFEKRNMPPSNFQRNFTNSRNFNNSYGVAYNNNNLVSATRNNNNNHMYSDKTNNLNKTYVVNSYNNGYNNNAYANRNANSYSLSQLYPPSYNSLNKSHMNNIIPDRNILNHSTIIVSNVPLDLSAEEIKQAFSSVGSIVKTEIFLNSQGSHTGRAAVVFESRNVAEHAVVRYDGGDLNRNKIRVFLE